MVGGVSPSAIAQLLNKSENINGVSALRKIGATEAQIKEHIKELKKLKYDRIVFIVATVNGEPIIFINDNLASMLDNGSESFKINPKSFLDKAKQMLKAAKADLTEGLHIKVPKHLRLTEQQVCRIVGKAVKNVLRRLY